MNVDINIKLRSFENQGCKEVLADFNPEQLEALALALISTEELRETSLLASAYIIATSVNPLDTAKSIMQLANKILEENNSQTINILENEKSN